jgi:hypothetical protein
MGLAGQKQQNSMQIEGSQAMEDEHARTRYDGGDKQVVLDLPRLPEVYEHGYRAAAIRPC